MTFEEILFINRTHDHRIAAFLPMCLVLLLFTGSFAVIWLLTFSTTAFAYSSTSSGSTTNSFAVNNKEISPQIKSFILNHIVNKSKAAIVVGFVDLNGTRIFIFGNMSKAHNIPVSENTLFDIGSITKLLLRQFLMVIGLS